MDQHEKDWLDLGRQLKDYTPDGDAAEDFLAFQNMKGQQPRKKRGAFWRSISLSLLIVFATVGLIVYGAGDNGWLTTGDLMTAPNIVPAVETAIASNEDLDEELTSAPVLVEEEVTVEVSASKAERLGELNRQQLTASSLSFAVPEEDDGNAQPGPVLEIVRVSPLTELEPAVINTEAHSFEPSAITAVTTLLPMKEITPLTNTSNSRNHPDPVLKKKPSFLQITLGTGLSNHWRGANFLQEVDRGIYAYIGVNRRIGQRFGLEGRIGYRGHGMRLPVFSDVDAPWSYHKEEIHNTGQMGEDRAYIYEGVVEGYQAVEFSLLAHYQLSKKLSLSGGVRYSLPDLAFERTVMGPDEENPFFEFIERQPLVKYQDYGALLGAEYHFSRFLALEAGLHLGMVDLIDDAAAGRVRFNHSSSVSIGVKYKLGE